MSERCDDCGSRHSLTFRDSEHGWTLCPECVSAYVSWILDGGMVEDPHRYDREQIDVHMSGDLYPRYIDGPATGSR